jgi:hypothetical protein
MAKVSAKSQSDKYFGIERVLGRNEVPCGLVSLVFSYS